MTLDADNFVLSAQMERVTPQCRRSLPPSIRALLESMCGTHQSRSSRAQYGSGTSWLVPLWAVQSTTCTGLLSLSAITSCHGRHAPGYREYGVLEGDTVGGVVERSIDGRAHPSLSHEDQCCYGPGRGVDYITSIALLVAHR